MRSRAKTGRICMSPAPGEGQECCKCCISVYFLKGKGGLSACKSMLTNRAVPNSVHPIQTYSLHILSHLYIRDNFKGIIDRHIFGI